MRTRGDHPSHRVLRVPRAEVFVYNTERLVNDLTRTSKFAEEKLEVIDERFDQIIKEFISKVKDIISSIAIQEEYLAKTPKTMGKQISDVMVHSKPRQPPFTSCVEWSKAEAFTYNTERLVNDLTRASKFAEEKLEVIDERFNQIIKEFSIVKDDRYTRRPSSRDTEDHERAYQ
ncbi:hypothetical protein HU200_007015 [Digitaria exilis]|uniref:Uncharacterized protein n=1 Tax=Digitaria exilis TaxID=1010633 RepID=A0A835FN61_9POAL|nr:hypothetical protein HU200_007015 [Digitaria exilis]